MNNVVSTAILFIINDVLKVYNSIPDPENTLLPVFVLAGLLTTPKKDTFPSLRTVV